MRAESLAREKGPANATGSLARESRASANKSLARERGSHSPSPLRAESLAREMGSRPMRTMSLARKVVLRMTKLKLPS